MTLAQIDEAIKQIEWALGEYHDTMYLERALKALREARAGLAPEPRRTMITETQIDHWFTYHAPESEADTEAYKELREAGKTLAKVILRLTPASADQSDAIRKVREAVWTANAARACKGH